MSENCYIWTRVSTRHQEDNGGSLDDQRLKCENYAKEHGYTICGYFGGTHESAKTPGRLVQQMIQAVKKNKNVNHIVVNQADRFSRNAGQAINIINELCKYNVQIDEVCGGITTATPEGKMMLQIKLSMAEWDNANRTNKFSSGIENCLRQGVYIGAKPLGYNKTGKSINTTYTINADGLLLKQAFQWKLRGMSNNKIAEKLSRLGLPMSKKHIHKILVNPFYAGKIKHKRLNYEMIDGKHPAIVSYPDFLRVQEILSGRTGVYQHKKETPRFPLKHHIICAQDGTPFTAYTVKKKNIDYYKCNKNGCKTNVSANKIHSKFVDLLQSYAIPNELREILKDIIARMIDSNVEVRKQQEILLHKQQTEIKNKIKGCKVKYGCGEIDEDVYELTLTTLQEKLDNVVLELATCHRELSNHEINVDTILEACCKLGSWWKNASLETCKKIQSLLFPSGILWDKEIDDYRTTTLNDVVRVINAISVFCKNKNGENLENFSPSVALCG